jgi:hypothetical protein
MYQKTMAEIPMNSPAPRHVSSRVTKGRDHARSFDGQALKGAVVAVAGESPRESVLDPRLAGLVLGTLDQVSAVVGSAISGLSYAAIRKFAGYSREDEKELRESLEAVAQTSTSFAEHRPFIELLVGVTALHAAKADQLLMLTDKQKPLSLREMFGVLLLIFAPLLLLGLIFLLKPLKAEK